MRTRFTLRKMRTAYGVGAITLTIPATALALGAGQSQAQSAPQFTLEPHMAAYGAPLNVHGTLSAADSGQRIELQYQQRGAFWRSVAYTTVQRNGSFRFVTRLWRSGLLRVLAATTATTAAANQPIGAQPSNSPLGPSAPESVAVAAKLRVGQRPINVLSGPTVDVRGDLLPGVPGRSVALQGRSGGRWHTLTSANTRAGGRFDLRLHAGALGAQRLRVRFAGDHSNTRSLEWGGLLTVYRESVASWYNDAGLTACGFHATLGVANKTLPCGTKVSFFYGGRKVTAVVDDRGPFVAGRDWDLNRNTAAALGVAGVATLWSSQ